MKYLAMSITIFFVMPFLVWLLNFVVGSFGWILFAAWWMVPLGYCILRSYD